ncbi:unnamed protein product [Rhizophagus irregularis]|nr:unnamed protein product [Rhizophagus irregularis]CAB4406096.1 unnamed protein product [Rhizophagus irregularis]
MGISVKQQPQATIPIIFLISNSFPSKHALKRKFIMFQTPFNECETPFTRDENEKLIIHEDTNRTFFHNYPPNPYIHAVRIFGGKNYSQSYNTVEWTDENGQVNLRYSLSSAGAASSLF